MTQRIVDYSNDILKLTPNLESMIFTNDWSDIKIPEIEEMTTRVLIDKIIKQSTA
jgi:hypothetical protein